MKRILLSLGVVGTVAVGVIAATGAFFSASTTSTNNTFQTANMSVELTNTSYTARVIDGRGMFPGAFVQSAVTINNPVGSVSFNPDLVLANANDLAGIAASMDFEVWTNGKLWYRGPLTSFPGYTGARVTLDKVNAGESVNVAFRLLLKESAPSSLVNANYAVDMNIVGRQWNDPSYAPTAPVETDTGKYLVDTWSYNVCGVRPNGFSPALGAFELYSVRSYDNVNYSPFYSYRVAETMANNDSKWALHTKPAFNYQGFNTYADGYCTPRDGQVNAAGYNVNPYVAPTTCDFTATPATTITAKIAAVAGSGNNEVICVAPGTYNEVVDINKEVKVSGLFAPNSANKAIVTGQVKLSGNGAKVMGLYIDPAANLIAGANSAVFVTAKNTVVDNNIISDLDGTGSASIIGIHVYNDTPPALQNITITNNKIIGVDNVGGKGAYGVMVQGKVDTVSVAFNSISNLTSPGGWGGSGIEVTPTSALVASPQNVSIMHNSINTIGAGTSEPGKAITIDAASYPTNVTDASQVIVHYNNFVNAGIGIRVLDPAHTAQAQQNFFDPSVTTKTIGNVDINPEAGSAYPMVP